MRAVSFCRLAIIWGLAVFAFPVSAQQVLNFRTEGSLEATHELGCLPAEEVKASYTPADLLPAFAACVTQERYDEATFLFAAASAYGAFDRARVADKTAHQASSVLILQASEPLEAAKKQKWQDSLQPTFAPGPAQDRICGGLRKLGKPDYDPQYMIRHGMSAFTGNAGDPQLIGGFEPDATWEKVLSEFMSCPA